MSWFDRKSEIEYQIIELDKPVQSLEGAADVAALAEHPGFRTLMARLKVQRALIESTLRTAHHADLSDVTRLQAGIAWLGYLERQVNLAVGKRDTSLKPRETYALEEEELRKIAAALQFVGRGKPE